MQDGANKKYGTIVILLSLLLLGMDGKHREGDEWRQLEARQAQLAARIKVLKQEQDFLLFQRSFAGADSKYILIDLSTKTGTLKYRNRVLRTFGFTLSSSKSHKPRKGRYVLTGKTDGSPGKMSLVVQDAFIIHGKRYSGRQKREKSLPAMVVGRKDLAAIYYAVEQGTMLYVFR